MNRYGRRTLSKPRTHKGVRLRPSLVPGAVLILLIGKHAGKRVVLLKALDNGELIVTGPHKLNGVPLLTVNHRYVAGTSTRVPLAGVALEKVTAEAVRAPARARSRGARESEAAFLAQSARRERAPVSEEKRQLQEEVDAALLAHIGKDADMKAYFKTPFEIKDSTAVHLLKF